MKVYDGVDPMFGALSLHEPACPYGVWWLVAHTVNHAIEMLQPRGLENARVQVVLEMPIVDLVAPSMVTPCD